MNPDTLRTRSLRVPLTRPYAIAGGSWDHVELAIVELRGTDGHIGYGQASPAPEVTGETIEQCVRELELCAHRLAPPMSPRDVCTGPAARAALDMAMWDLFAKQRGVPLVERLGRAHMNLETSITIGVKSVEETLAEAREYLGRGFRVLKVKTGVDVDDDVERLTRLREAHGAAIVLRVDANQGYDELSLARFLEQSDALGIELIEQPLPPSQDAALLRFSADQRRRFVADESVHDEAGLELMIAAGKPFGVVNVKLMKCGGISAGLSMARIARRAGLALMWGCMDESVVGISAALHAALASPATRYLDLDGSLDLAQDPFRGGFSLATGRMDTLARPGLGVDPT